MIRSTSMVLSLAGLALLLGCDSTTRSDGKKDKAKPTPPAVRTNLLVTGAWLADHLQDANLVVLHVAKTRENYDKGHVPGARYVAEGEVASERDGVLRELPPLADLTDLVRRLGIDGDSRLVIYDEGVGIDAARTYMTLDYLGLGDQAALLDGQWKTWAADKRPISLTAPTVTATEFEPKVNKQVIAGLGEVRGLCAATTQPGEAWATLVDARSQSQYSGEVAGSAVPRGGHIPGAVNVYSMRAVQSEDRPLFKPADELRRVFTSAGVTGGKPVVTYCRTGGQASLNYFALKYLGYDARLYDGSFSQWSSQPDTPVEK